MLLPSNADPAGGSPTVKVPMFTPSLARNLVTLPLPLFPTQMLAPSKANPIAREPTGKVQVPTQAPSLARSLVTVLLLPVVTQMLAPSNNTFNALPPGATMKVPNVVPS